MRDSPSEDRFWDGVFDDPITPEQAREVAANWKDTTQLSNALDAAAREIDRLRDALGKIASQQRKTLGWITKHGIVFDGPLGADPENWENVAFSIYTDLCEVDGWARQALGESE